MPTRGTMNFYAKSAAVAAAVAAMAAAPAFAADPPAGTPDQDNNPGAVHKPDTTPPTNDGTEHKPDSTPPTNDGTEHKPDGTPGPKAGLPAKVKAYGRYCKGESKKHVEGQKGTPFSQCVTAMAKLATGKNTSPRKACKELSKKHVEGEKGTPFSLCVSQGAKLLRQHDDDGEE